MLDIIADLLVERKFMGDLKPESLFVPLTDTGKRFR
jgi:hypothetical protein